MRKEKFCSFCGKTSKETSRLVAGPGVYICDECIMSCYEIVIKDIPPVSLDKIPTPMEIYQEINKHVISQERAKKVLSVAVYNHYKRVKHNRINPNARIEKSNILMFGPTGAGKTLLVETIAKYLNVPFAIADASTLTEAGYVGEDVENILLRLIENAEYDIERAEMGIVYIDEFDKLARKPESPSITRDVSGEGVQHALLKILEGTIANVPPQGGRKHPYQDFIKINTRDILFICGGAFTGLKPASRRPIGFHCDEPKTSQIITHKDFIKYGIVPECLGRLQTIVMLEELTRDDLVKVLTDPVNSIIKQYQKLLKLDGVELEFQKDALYKIADEALKLGMGARGLRTILDDMLLDIMFQIPSKNIKKCIITKDLAKPIFYPRKEAV